jgi:hypothetical protein
MAAIGIATTIAGTTATTGDSVEGKAARSFQPPLSIT